MLWREIIVNLAQTVALSGCSTKGCLGGTPPKLCVGCQIEITRLLLESSREKRPSWVPDGRGTRL